ncbi:hypothetical protein L195_g045764, partial [Trifolium pratense]
SAAHELAQAAKTLGSHAWTGNAPLKDWFIVMLIVALILISEDQHLSFQCVVYENFINRFWKEGVAVLSIWWRLGSMPGLAFVFVHGGLFVVIHGGLGVESCGVSVVGLELIGVLVLELVSAMSSKLAGEVG